MTPPEIAIQSTVRASGTLFPAGRFSTVEGDEFIQRRLATFYGYVALLSTLATATSYALMADPVFKGMRQLQLLHAGVLLSAFALLRARLWPLAFAMALDVFGMLVTAGVAASVLATVPYVTNATQSAVAFFILFFVVRAALVPSSPLWASGVAAVCLVPFAFGVAEINRRAGAALIPDPEGATFGSVRSMLAGVIGVHIVSRTVYGLRRAVQRARQLGQYIVHERIGAGGMGTIYRASHARLKRPTALKVTSVERATEQQLARFESEALATSRLTHPNTIAVYDFGRTSDGVFYYAMELLDGVDLGELVATRGPRSETQARHILRQVAGALSEAHAAGLVHRDIKPENIMLCTRGGLTDFVKVLDFGLVKRLAATGAPLTQDQAIAGTPLFMAPESITKPELVGPPVDIYGLGCVAYFLLTGNAPFEGESIAQVCGQHIHAAPAPVSASVPDISSELDALVLRCLAKSPEARPTAEEIVARLTGA